MLQFVRVVHEIHVGRPSFVDPAAFCWRFCSELVRLSRLAAARRALGVVSVTLAEPGRFTSTG